MTMNVTTKYAGSTAVVAVNGRIDSANAKDFDQKLSEVIDRGGSRLVIDCGDLTYISSAGLRAILLAIKRTNAAGGGMAMCRTPDHIREVLEVSGFTRLIQVYETVEDAEAGFSG